MFIYTLPLRQWDLCIRTSGWRLVSRITVWGEGPEKTQQSVNVSDREVKMCFQKKRKVYSSANKSWHPTQQKLAVGSHPKTFAEWEVVKVCVSEVAVEKYVCQHHQQQTRKTGQLRTHQQSNEASREVQYVRPAMFSYGLSWGVTPLQTSPRLEEIYPRKRKSQHRGNSAETSGFTSHR